MSDHDGYTISAPPCAEHPPLEDWPMRNLLLGTCPGCGCGGFDDRAIGRMIRARQLIREREAA